MDNLSHVRYPRRRAIRLALRLLVRLLLPLLARPLILGRENLPRKGPAILAGNHVAVLEIVLMLAYSPASVEFLGASDIPLDPKFAWLADLYGFIPVQRGTIDRKGIKMALSVLEQGGVIGIFPQGGIWDTSVSHARLGAALLSQMGKAPVTPIGFGGMSAALRRMLSFKRPRLVMNVGKRMTFPSSLADAGDPRRALEAFAGEIIQRILALLPPEERLESGRRADEIFDVEVSFICEGQQEITALEEQLDGVERAALGRFLHYPILLDALARNLKLPVQPLQRLDESIKPEDLRTACASILDYLRQNPGFFTYRFGVQSGLEIEAALEKLAEITRQLAEAGNLSGVKIVPIYRYRDSTSGEMIEQRGARSLHSM